jgi:hypothetical protein
MSAKKFLRPGGNGWSRPVKEFRLGPQIVKKIYVSLGHGY